MDKSEFMKTLESALTDLPGEIIESTMWEYQKKFVDGKVAGRSESEIAHELGYPRLIAAKLRAEQQIRVIKRQVSVQSVFSLLITLMGIAVFNLFLIVPVVTYFCVLFATFISAFVFYGIGILMLASGLAGVPQFSFEPGIGSLVMFADDGKNQIDSRQTSVQIDETGIHVNDAGLGQRERISLTVSSGMTSEAAAVKGLGILTGGIALLMLCLIATRFTFAAFKRYVLWSASLLRAPFVVTTPLV